MRRGEEEDSSAELVDQLLQYKMYKYMSYELRDRQVEGERSLYREPDIPEEVQDYVEPASPCRLSVWTARSSRIRAHGRLRATSAALPI